MQNILIIVGSLAKQSTNRAIGNFIVENYSNRFNFKFAEIGDLPLYSQDLDENSPASYERFRQEVKEADGVLIISPEHNRNMPAALKNAIDAASRPWGQSVWNNKPIAIITAAAAMGGGMAANFSIRNTFVVLNAPVMPTPEAYYGAIYNNIDENGKLTGEFIPKALVNFMASFETWIKRFN